MAIWSTQSFKQIGMPNRARYQDYSVKLSSKQPRPARDNDSCRFHLIIMRIVLQRVTRASVSVSDREIAQIGPGLVLLVGVGPADQPEQARYLAEKIAHLRIFEDQAGKMNRSLLDVGGEAIVVSQFTLFADARKGRRPSFTDAAQPHIAQPLVDQFTTFLTDLGIPTQSGKFGAHMLVEIANDGPVTIILER